MPFIGSAEFMDQAKLKIVSDIETRRQDTKKILEDVLEDEYDTVVVFGIKDGKIYSHISSCPNRHTLMGMLLEAAIELKDI